VVAGLKQAAWSLGLETDFPGLGGTIRTTKPFFMALLPGEWYHIAGAYDGTTVKCYLDGVETDSAPMSGFASSASSFLIGSDGWRSDWVGAIDDVQIYDRGLSEAEILSVLGGM